MSRGGIARGGALRATTGTASVTGPVTLAGASPVWINVTGTQLNLSQTGAGNAVTNTAGFTKTGSGILELGGANANTGTGAVNIFEGTLQLNKAAGTAAIAGGAITIGPLRRRLDRGRACRRSRRASPSTARRAAFLGSRTCIRAAN